MDQVFFFLSYLCLNPFLKWWLSSTHNTLSPLPSTRSYFLWGARLISVLSFHIPLKSFSELLHHWGYFMLSFLIIIFQTYYFPFQLINQLTNSILNPRWLLSWVFKECEDSFQWNLSQRVGGLDSGAACLLCDWIMLRPWLP